MKRKIILCKEVIVAPVCIFRKRCGGGRCKAVCNGEKIITEISIEEKTIKPVSSPNTLRIYPNPVSKGNLFYIKCENDQKALIKVFNIQGKTIFQGETENLKTNGFITIAADDRWSAGAYFVQVTNGTGQVTGNGKIIVQQ